MVDERFQIELADGSPFTLTVAWWHNALVTRHRMVGGERVEVTHWHKHLSHGGRGWYDRVEYGRLYDRPAGFGGRCADPAMEAHDGHGHQAAIICARATRLFAIDVDDPDAYATTHTAGLVSAIQATTRRGRGWHALVAVPEALLEAWPGQGVIPGADVKANGFVPMPGCFHYSGEEYADAGGDVLVATAGLLEAIRADRRVAASRREGASGGDRGEGNEPQLLAYAGTLVALGMSEDEAWEAWLRHAQTLPWSDPTWPWTADDRDVFDRHWDYCRRRHGENHASAGEGVDWPAALSQAQAGGEGEPAVRQEEAGGGDEPPAGGGQPPVGGGEGDGDGGSGDGEPRGLDPLAPSPEDPMAVARYLGAAWEHPDGVMTLASWRDAWLRWTGASWTEVTERTVRNEVYRALEHKSYEATRNGEREWRPWQPNATRVNNVLDAAKVVTAVDDAVEPGTWIVPRRGALLREDGQLVACRNALVNPETRAVIAPSPRYLNLHALPFDYDPQATCPRWERFLDSVFPGDAESVSLLREWFGYVISGRTSLQKMMLLVGAPRSGKGVTARVLTQLVGETAVAGPPLAAFTTNFGISTLVDKPLAVIGDARVGSKADKQVVVERLLSITGEDRIDIDRKNRAIWTGKLPTRIMMLSNELPWLQDASAAIARRMLVLMFPRSFLGREDLRLEAELAAELAGILNWALAGLDELLSQGRFTAPVASEGAVAELERATSPVRQFVEEMCELGEVTEGYHVPTDELARAWVAWNGAGTVDRATQTRLGLQLAAAYSGVTKRRMAVAGEERQMYYLGLRLTPSAVAWAARRGGQP